MQHGACDLSKWLAARIAWCVKFIFAALVKRLPERDIYRAVFNPT
jgi:hypothetical protein